MSRPIQTLGIREIAPSPSDKSISKAFYTALLLTADTDLAELSVMEAIASLERPVCENTLLLSTIEAALQNSDVLSWSTPCPSALAMLPPELRNVTALPARERKSFILRILAELPQERCARVLSLTPQQVSEDVVAAMQHLLTIASVETSAVVVQ